MAPTERPGAAPADASDLSVVIPTRDRWSVLQRTLAGLEAQRAAGFETVVVVDGTDQAVPALAPTLAGGPLRTLSRPRGGPGAARNTGVQASQRPIVLFLGDDMVPTPELVSAHLAVHRRDPAPQRAVLGSVGWHPELGGRRLLHWLDWSGAQFDFASITGGEAGFGHFYSCNVSVKRELLGQVGGFDEDFAYYYEDLDLGWRLAERGMRLAFEPAARAHHLHDYDWESLQRRFAGVARGEALMAAKHPWFEPFFSARARAALARRPVGRAWPLLAHRSGLDPVRRRADTWYWQQLGAGFLDAWEAERDLEELRAYLGPDYDHARLVDHEGEVEREAARVGDEATLYRTSEAYLYDLTAFAMSATKSPYLRDLRRLAGPGTSILDYGCGIGSDGLRLLEDGAGRRVAFADFDNPSTRYLRWRLARRGLDAPVYDLDAEEVPGGFDAAFAFDVIEHVEDPFAFLAELERRAGLVVVNLLEPEPPDLAPDPHAQLHRPLPIAALIEHAERSGLALHRLYHGRSHLIAYRSPRSPSGRPGRARGSRPGPYGRRLAARR